MIEQLSAYMLDEGYQRVMTNIPGIIFMFRQEMQSVNVLLVIEYRQGVYVTADQYRLLKQQMREIFRQKGAGELHIMSLLIAENPEAVRKVSEDDRFCWLIDSKCLRLMICEDRVEDFYGLRRILERFLARCKEGGAEADRQLTDETARPRETQRRNTNEAYAQGRIYGKKRPAEILRTMPLITVILVCANILIYLICTWGTELLYNIGGLEGHRVVEDKEFYRVFTSMFLHLGTEHLFGNMLVLFFLGEVTERALGRLRYALLYVFSGVGAAAASVYMQYHTNELIRSVGASGAIYGVLGAILYLVVAGRGRFQGITLARMGMFLVYSLYSGFKATNIDNAAHIGGLVCGFVLTALFTFKRKGTGRA